MESIPTALERSLPLKTHGFFWVLYHFSAILFLVTQHPGFSVFDGEFSPMLVLHGLHFKYYSGCRWEKDCTYLLFHGWRKVWIVIWKGFRMKDPMVFLANIHQGWRKVRFNGLCPRYGIKFHPLRTISSKRYVIPAFPATPAFPAFSARVATPSVSKTIENYRKVSKTIEKYRKLSKIVEKYRKVSNSSEKFVRDEIIALWCSNLDML